MSDEGFLLVGLPEDPDVEVPSDTVKSASITTNDARGDVIVDCLEDIDATVEHIETDYLPLWKVSMDEEFRPHVMLTFDAPGVSSSLHVNMKDTLSIPYPDDGKME